MWSTRSYWHLRSVRESAEVWLRDPLCAVVAWLRGTWARRVLLPAGTWLAQRLTRLALRIAPEVVVAETEGTSRAWADLFAFAERATLPLLPAIPAAVPAAVAVPPVPSVRDVATLSAIAAALGLDPDPILPDSKVLPRALGNAITEAETQTVGWPDRLAHDLARAVLCWPRRVDVHLAQMLAEAGKLAPGREHESEASA